SFFAPGLSNPSVSALSTVLFCSFAAFSIIASELFERVFFIPSTSFFFCASKNVLKVVVGEDELNLQAAAANRNTAIAEIILTFFMMISERQRFHSLSRWERVWVRAYSGKTKNITSIP